MIYKTLSVKQPWAYLQCAKIKDIENRTWPLPKKYKNEWVLIHSSAKKGGNSRLRHFAGMLTQKQLDRVNDVLPIDWPFMELHFSAIIGAVKYSDCEVNYDSIWAEDSWGKEKTVYNWVVSESVLFDKPILDVKGKLSFWDFDLPGEYVELLK